MSAVGISFRPGDNDADGAAADDDPALLETETGSAQMLLVAVEIISLKGCAIGERDRRGIDAAAKLSAVDDHQLALRAEHASNFAQGRRLDDIRRGKGGDDIAERRRGEGQRVGLAALEPRRRACTPETPRRQPEHLRRGIDARVRYP